MNINDNTNALQSLLNNMNSGSGYFPTSAVVQTSGQSETLVMSQKAVTDFVKSTAFPLPEYWKSELESKVDSIQQAMEATGRNKSAFLWYTDAHWQNNAKVSPALLKHLVENTPINKVNFGGDIIGDPSPFNHNNIKYVYEWRKLISDLPNHHSVYGNHDVNHRTTDVSNMAYAYILASEESSDMVVGGDSYYYIDSPSEKTRYLYLSYMTNDSDAMLAQGQFIADAIKGVSDGWHIVAISHRWWQYTSSSNPTVGAVPAFEKDILSVFDAYNARQTRNGSNYFYAQDFTNAKGKVEFCIGGHIHVDYDFESDGGIPVIITASDTNQERASGETEDCGALGTITESAVYGIIADYSTANTKITVVGVGRGTSRVVRASNIKPTSVSNITYSGDTTVGASIDKSKFSFTVNYSNGTTDTIVGASSVSPSVINAVGNNTVTITYTEGSATVTGTMTIVGTPVPVVNLFNANRTFVAGTADAMLHDYLDESKAYTNVAYSNGKFNASACTVSGVTEDGLTVKESGIGGIVVAYAFYLPDIKKDKYKITFDYSGTGKCRTYYRYAVNGVVGGCESLFLNDTAGASGSADVIIPANTDHYTWLIIMFGSNTGGTKTFENITLTKVEDNSSSTNLIDTVGYNDNMRLSTSDGVTLKEATGYTTTGLIDISNYTGTVQVYAQGVNFNKQTYEHAFMYTYNDNGTFNTAYAMGNGSSNNVSYTIDENGNLTLVFDMANCGDWMKRFRLTGYGSGANLVITIS